MSDKELVINSTVKYIGSISKDLFGIKMGVATETIARIGVNNMLAKSPYKEFCDFIFDADNNLPSKEDFFSALKDIISQKPLVAFGIKFNAKDVEAIEELFNKEI